MDSTPIPKVILVKKTDATQSTKRQHGRSFQRNAFCSPGRLTFHPSDSPEIDLSLGKRIPLHLARSIDLGARVGRSGPRCMSFFGLEGRHLWLEAERFIEVSIKKYQLLYVCVYLVDEVLLLCCCRVWNRGKFRSFIGSRSVPSTPPTFLPPVDPPTDFG